MSRSVAAIRADIVHVESVVDRARDGGQRHPQHGELIGVLYRLRAELMWRTDPILAALLYPEFS